MTVDLRRALLSNWPIKLTALALAAVLWAVVAAEQPTTQFVPVSLILEAPEGRAVTQSLPPIRALYTGSARELLKLRGSPPEIVKIIPDTAVGTRLVFELSPGDLTMTEEANVKALDVQPRRIEVFLEAIQRPHRGKAGRGTRD